MPQVISNLEGTQKLQDLILYISKMSEGDPTFGAVKLNKILFFSDFRHFLDTGKSMTGQEYQKLSNGPAPRQMLPVLEHLQEQKRLAIAEREYFGRLQKRPMALREPDLSLFSGREIAIVDATIQKLYKLNASETSDLSHEFPGWQGVALNETIPYESVLLDPREITPEEREWALDTTGMESLVAS